MASDITHRNFAVQTFITTFTQSAFATLNHGFNNRASTDIWGRTCVHMPKVEPSCFADLISKFLCGAKEKVKTCLEKKKGEYDRDGESWNRLLFNSQTHVSNLI